MFWLFNLLFLIQFNQSGSSFSPADFVWKNRLVIINGECKCSEWFSHEIEKDLYARKLLVFHFIDSILIKSNFEGELKTAEFLELIPQIGRQPETWALVGLDGGVKYSGKTKPFSDEVFRLVDAMPMRQFELPKKQNLDNTVEKLQESAKKYPI